MQIRNALIILMRILPHFPMLVKLSQIIERKIEKVREEERHQRQDLFVLASSYIGQLKARSCEMIKEVDFHQVSDKPSKDGTASSTISAAAAAAAAAVASAVASVTSMESNKSSNSVNGISHSTGKFVCFKIQIYHLICK